MSEELLLFVVLCLFFAWLYLFFELCEIRREIELALKRCYEAQRELTKCEARQMGLEIQLKRMRGRND